MILTEVQKGILQDVAKGDIDKWSGDWGEWLRDNLCDLISLGFIHVTTRRVILTEAGAHALAEACGGNTETKAKTWEGPDQGSLFPGPDSGTETGSGPTV